MPFEVGRDPDPPATWHTRSSLDGSKAVKPGREPSRIKIQRVQTGESYGRNPCSNNLTDTGYGRTIIPLDHVPPGLTRGPGHPPCCPAWSLSESPAKSPYSW